MSKKDSKKKDNKKTENKKVEAKKVTSLKKAIKARKEKIAKHEGKLLKLKKKLKKAA